MQSIHRTKVQFSISQFVYMSKAAISEYVSEFRVGGHGHARSTTDASFEACVFDPDHFASNVDNPLRMCENGCPFRVQRNDKCEYCIANMCNYPGCRYRKTAGAYCSTHRRRCGLPDCERWAIHAANLNAPTTYRCPAHRRHKEALGIRNYPKTRKSSKGKISKSSFNHRRNLDKAQTVARSYIEQHLRRIVRRNSDPGYKPRGKNLTVIDRYTAPETSVYNAVVRQLEDDMTISNLGSAWRITTTYDTKLYDLKDPEHVRECYHVNNLIVCRIDKS